MSGALDEAVGQIAETSGTPARSPEEAIGQMRRQDEEFARARERLRATDPAPAPIGPTLEEILARAQAAYRFPTDLEIAASEARMQREAWRDRLSSSGILASLRDEDRARVLDDALDETDALRATRAWLAKATQTPDPDRNVLALCGPRGLGKTIAAAWALSRRGGVYATVETYLRDHERWLRDRSYDDETSQATQRMERYRTAHLVVLDEIGTERNAEAMRAAFFRLMDHRQSRRRQLTILLTNLSRADFVARLERGVYDERTTDRFRRDLWAVGLAGESMRRAEP